MFEVKYCPKIARFRELLKLYNEDSLEELVLQLQTLKLCDDELFISLVCGLIIHFLVLFFLYNPQVNKGHMNFVMFLLQAMQRQVYLA